MPQIAENVKHYDVVSSLNMPGTGKLIVLAILQHKTMDVAKLMELTGESRRTVQMYKLQWVDLSERHETSEISFANCAKDAKHVSCDVIELFPAHIEERARLNELPTEVSYSEVEDRSLSEVPSDVLVEVAPKHRKGRRRFAYTPEFEAFWSQYPDVSNNSKSEAFAEWLLLLPAEHELATAGLKNLAAHCRKNPDYRCVHAVRYLKQRRWESYAAPAPKPVTKPMNRLEYDEKMDAYWLSLANGMPSRAAQ